MKLGKTNNINNISSQEVLVTSSTLTGFTGNVVVAYSNSDPKNVDFIQDTMPVGTILNIVPKVSAGAIVGPVVSFINGSNIILNTTFALDDVTDTLSVWFDGSYWQQLNAFGVQGSQGGAGVQGSQGANGAQGDVGSPGAQGGSGSQGAQGDSGDPGVTGSQGAQGDNGT
jgi:hypothetical protein